MAIQAAFEEMPSYQQVLNQWEVSHERWHEIKSERVLKEIDGEDDQVTIARREWWENAKSLDSHEAPF